MRLRSVDLPDPEGPISATKSPRSMSSESPSSTRTNLGAAAVLLDELPDPDDRSGTLTRP